MNQNPTPENENQGPIYVDNRVYNAPQAPSAIPHYTIPQAEVETEPPMRVRDYLLLFLLSCVPCIGLILHIVWAFSSEPGKKSRQSYCKAYLLWMLISIGIGVIMYIITFVLMMVLGLSVAEIFSEASINYYSALPFLF